MLSQFAPVPTSSPSILLPLLPPALLESLLVPFDAVALAFGYDIPSDESRQFFWVHPCPTGVLVRQHGIIPGVIILSVVAARGREGG